MKEQTIEVTKNYNIKTDGKYCMYAHTETVSSIYSPTSSYDVVNKCRYLDKSSLKCNLFEKDLKETKLEKIKRCKECLSAKTTNQEGKIMNEVLEYIEKAVKEFCDIPPSSEYDIETLKILLRSNYFALIQSEIIEDVYLTKKEKHIYQIKDKFISIIINYRSENYDYDIEEYDLSTIKFATPKKITLTIWD